MVATTAGVYLVLFVVGVRDGGADGVLHLPGVMTIPLLVLAVGRGCSWASWPSLLVHRGRHGARPPAGGAPEGHGDDAVAEAASRRRACSSPRDVAARRLPAPLEGERFLKNYAPNAMGLASRDVISRAEHDRDRRRPRCGRRRPPRPTPSGRRPNNRAPARHSRGSGWSSPASTPSTSPSPVRPSSHYHMGGGRPDLVGKTVLEGLYAAPASAPACRCTGPPPRWHRLEARHLRHAARQGRPPSGLWRTPSSPRPSRRSPTPSGRWRGAARPHGGRERPHGIRDEMASTMHENFGVFRREEQMRLQGEIIGSLRRSLRAGCRGGQGGRLQLGRPRRWNWGSLLDLAACMVEAGLARKESRGAHARPYDYPGETMSTSCSTRSSRGPAIDSRSSGRHVTMTKWEA